jgi:hypothetical protein
MLFNGKLIEQLGVEQGIDPQNVTGTATTSLWYDLSEYQHIVFIISQGAWPGGTPAVTLNQATSSAGAGSKALTLTEYWQMTADQTQAASAWARTAVVSNTFNLPATAHVITIVEADARQLDINNSFKWAQLAIASPGSNNDLLSVVVVLTQPRDQRFPPRDAKV